MSEIRRWVRFQLMMRHAEARGTHAAGRCAAGMWGPMGGVDGTAYLKGREDVEVGKGGAVHKHALFRHVALAHASLIPCTTN